jgi:hypothetical protein
MSPCFADTFYFLAMLNPKDEAYPRATALTASLRRPLVTTTWVLTEVADALAHTRDRLLFPVFLSSLRADSRATVVPTSDDLFGRGVALYSARPDKQWSLTDCISFTLMRQLGIEEALTADHHFEQAGFRAMLR